MNIKVTLLALLAMNSAAFALPLGIDFTDHTYAPINGLRGQYSNDGITFTNAFPTDLFFPGQPAAPFVYSSTLGVAIANGAPAQISANTWIMLAAGVGALLVFSRQAVGRRIA